MSIYKRHHLLKSAFKITVILLLLLCVGCWRAGYLSGTQAKLTIDNCNCYDIVC